MDKITSSRAPVGAKKFWTRIKELGEKKRDQKKEEGLQEVDKKKQDQKKKMEECGIHEEMECRKWEAGT